MAIDSIVKKKSMAFAIRTVRLYQFLVREHREYVLSKQVLRSGTSVGANITEAIYGSSRKDFTAKLQIAQKEAAETLYWLELLYTCEYIPDNLYQSLVCDCKEILAILAATIKSLKA